MKNKIYITWLLVFVVQLGFGQFTYERTLDSVSDLWHRVKIPAQVFVENENQVSDFRVLGVRGEDTLEAPYVYQVLKPSVETVDVPLDVINRSINRASGYSYITFRLDQAQDYNYIDFDVRGDNFNIYLTLEGSDDGKEWFEFARRKRIVAHHDEFAEYRFTEVDFPTVNYAYVRVKYLTQHPRWFLYLFDKHYNIKNAQLKKRIELSGGIEQVNHEFLVGNNKQKKNTTVDLKFDVSKRISSLKLSVGDTLDFYRSIKIERVTDSVQNAKGEFKYIKRTVYTGVINSYTKSIFEFDEVFTNRLIITIDNDDNMPLKVKRSEVFAYTQYLAVRFPDKGKYSLFYGDKVLYRPQYDIVQFDDPLSQEMSVLELGKSIQLIFSSTEEKVFDSKSYLMWGVIVLLVLLMAGFTVKMIRTESKGD